MVLNTQENQSYSGQTSSQLTKFFAWKWEKKHWLLVIAVACLLLCWLGPWMLEFSLVQKAVKLLPIIGSVAFASEGIFKLLQ